MPVVFWLSGLTCTDENFIQKSGEGKARQQWCRFLLSQHIA